MSKSVAFASHVTLIEGKEYDGIGNVLKDVLPAISDDFIFVRHSMEGGLASQVQYFDKGVVTRTKELGVISGIGPLRYITEVISTVRFFKKNPVDVFIGIDPLNALAGVILKKAGAVKKTVFYTADYSVNRFSLKLLNYIYHRIDMYCVTQSDEVWSVSPRIVKIRESMGLASKKNILLPNVPPEKYNYMKDNVHNRQTLFTCGIVDTQLDFESSIRAVSILRDEFPDLQLVVVGNGPEVERLEALAVELDVVERVHLKGRRDLSGTLDEMSKAGIGLALYTGVWGFNEYGDSTKCREFANFGLPIITTDTHATVPEIVEYEAGVVTEPGVEHLVTAIKKVLEHYDDYSEKSVQLGAAHTGAHRKILQRVLG